MEMNLVYIIALLAALWLFWNVFKRLALFMENGLVTGIKMSERSLHEKDSESKVRHAKRTKEIADDINDDDVKAFNEAKSKLASLDI